MPFVAGNRQLKLIQQFLHSDWKLRQELFGLEYNSHDWSKWFDDWCSTELMSNNANVSNVIPTECLIKQCQ